METKAYVTTWKRYNEGASGAWLDFSDPDAFRQRVDDLCEAWGEDQPETAVHDLDISDDEYEWLYTFVDDFTSASSLADMVEEFQYSRVDGRTLTYVAAYNGKYDFDSTLSDAREAVVYKSKDDAVEDYIECCFCDLPDRYRVYLDRDMIWRDLEADCYHYLDDHDVVVYIPY